MQVRLMQYCSRLGKNAVNDHGKVCFQAQITLGIDIACLICRVYLYFCDKEGGFWDNIGRGVVLLLLR